MTALAIERAERVRQFITTISNSSNNPSAPILSDDEEYTAIEEGNQLLDFGNTIFPKIPTDGFLIY